MSRSVCEAPPAFVLELLRAAECVAASVQGEQLPCPKLPDDLQEPLDPPSNQSVTEQAEIENTTTVSSWDTFQTTDGLTPCSSEPPSTVVANTDNLHFGLITSILESLSQSDLNEALQTNAESVSRHQTNLGNTPTASLPDNSEAGLQLIGDVALQSTVNSKIDHHSLQQNDINHRNACCIVPVSIPEKHISDSKFPRQFLEGTTRQVSSSRGIQSDKNMIVAYENRENFPCSYLQEISGSHPSLLPMQKSPLPNKFTLLPGPSPIMSPKEIPPSSKYDGPVSQAMVEFFHNSNNSIAIATTSAPKQHDRFLGRKRTKSYSNGERNGKDNMMSGEGKIKTYTKRARFARCTKKLKYLCSVCSKPDCMKCTHCINRSTGHQACLEKPKEQCLSYIKMLHEMESHNPEENGEDIANINHGLTHQPHSVNYTKH